MNQLLHAAQSMDRATRVREQVQHVVGGVVLGILFLLSIL